MPAIYVDADYDRRIVQRMTRIVHLARHGTHAEVGRVLSGRCAIELNQVGIEEASLLASRLACLPLGAIYSSPLARAHQTASIVAERHELNVDVRDALDEIDFGEWTGVSFTTLDSDPRWHHWNAKRGSSQAPGGETMQAAVARALTFLREIQEPEVLCVSHCDVIRGVVATCLGLDLDRLLAFDCDPASLTTLVFEQGGARLVTLNERPYLSA